MDEKKHQSGHVTETPDTSHIKNMDVTHETSDVQVGSIAKFVIGLVVLTVATHIGLWGMFVMMERTESKKERERPRPPMAVTGQLPPEPRLQSAPAFAENLEPRNGSEHAEAKASPTMKESPEATDPRHESPKDPLWEIKILNDQWHDVLEHGPLDQHGKRYGMPIEKAKEEILKHGLPVREPKVESRKQ